MENAAWYLILALLFALSGFLVGMTTTRLGRAAMWLALVCVALAVIRFTIGLVVYLKNRKQK